MRRATSFFALTLIATFLFGCTSEDTGGGPPNEPGFVAHYLSSWAAPHMHFSVQGGEWTEAPGMAMEPEGEGWFVYAHPEGPGVEFAFNNSGAEWDNNGDQNYQTDLPEFWVKDGTIHDAFPDGSTGPWCDAADCGMGTCNDAEQRCDCDTGYLFDSAAQTCVADACAGAQCGLGELCNPDDGTCLAACTPDRTAGDFTFCTSTTDSGVSVIARYEGAASIDAAASEVRLNTAIVDLDDSVYDAASKTFFVTETGLPPSKYSVLLRLVDSGGSAIEPLYVPMWIGAGMRFSEISWKDGILYQIMTDRWLNGDLSNDLDNSMGTLAEVDDFRSQWQGGDFRGIIDKIEDGYFTDMGINVLWISSPLLNSHNSQPSVGLNDPRRFASYHSYHPVVTGFRDGDSYGYDQPIETAFGSEAELHELIDKAHARGIRIVPDFVANHVHIEAQMYQDHPEWFFGYNPCDGNWDAHRVDCWFTTDMPDFDYEGNPAAVDAVVEHAIWMIQEYNFDGFRADALKHMSDDFTRALKVAVKERIETTVDNHDLSEEPTIFYMVGESLGGWARYHVRADMVQGQVDEDYYINAKNALLTYQMSVADLANFALYNDTAYLTAQPTQFGQMAGYPGAIMGNFFGNHDQWRALTEAGGDHKRLRLAQAFLFTSPGNIPMLYQGDDIGTYGEGDPDNREMMRFDGLTSEEQTSLVHAQKLGKVREEHVALRRGLREHVVVEDWYWVFKVSYESDEVFVILNRDADKTWDPPAGYSDVMGNCAGGNVPSQTACVFVAN